MKLLKFTTTTTRYYNNNTFHPIKVYLPVSLTIRVSGTSTGSSTALLRPTISSTLLSNWDDWWNSYLHTWFINNQGVWNVHRFQYCTVTPQNISRLLQLRWRWRRGLHHAQFPAGSRLGRFLKKNIYEYIDDNNFKTVQISIIYFVLLYTNRKKNTYKIQYIQYNTSGVTTQITSICIYAVFGPRHNRRLCTDSHWMGHYHALWLLLKCPTHSPFYHCSSCSHACYEHQIFCRFY